MAYSIRDFAKEFSYPSLDVVVHPLLPIVPMLEEDVIRMVRHGLADVARRPIR